MLPCIKREQQVLTAILDNRKETAKQLIDYYKEHKEDVSQIVFIGSGSSNTSSVAAFQMVEKFSGVSTSTMIPNLFLNKSVYDPKALCIFISQTGSSTLTQSAVKRAKENGCVTVAMSEAGNTKVAKEANLFVNMGCGEEEYGQRTIGFSSTVLTEMVIGLEMGLVNGTLSEEEYNRYIEDAYKMAGNINSVIDQTDDWYQSVKEIISNGSHFMILGPKSLYGVALEGALKILEVDKRYSAVGYEMDDGLHGPNMGLTRDNKVIVLSDGVSDQVLAQGIAQYVKNEVGNAFIIGRNTIDATDFPLDYKSEYFFALEFAPVLQYLSYRLAVDFGVEVPLFKDLVLPDQKYFNTHSEHLGK